MLFREVTAILKNWFLNVKEGDTNGSHCILNGFILLSDVTFNIRIHELH
jgi:hypothetical protein